MRACICRCMANTQPAPASTPSDALLHLLHGNVFADHRITSAAAARRLQRQLAVHLHPDRLSAGDVAFLSDHAGLLRRLLPSSAWSDSHASVPILLLEHQRVQHVELLVALADALKRGGDEAAYCVLCDQVIDERASPPQFVRAACKGVDGRTHWWFHVSCLATKGVEAVKTAYANAKLPADSPPWNVIMEMLPNTDTNGHVDAWMWVAQQYVDKRAYEPALKTFAAVLPGPASWEHRGMLAALGTKMQTEDKMHLTAFADLMRPLHGASRQVDVYTNVYVAEGLLNSFVLSRVRFGATPESILAELDLFVRSVPFMQHYIDANGPSGGETMLCDYVLHKTSVKEFELLAPLVTGLLSRWVDVKRRDFFRHVGHFSTLADRNERLARQVLAMNMHHIADKRQYDYCRSLCYGR